MLYSWMFKGSTFSGISTAVRCILKSKQLATSRHFHEAFRNTSEVMSSQDVNLNPPDSVRGMIKLNRDIFNKIITIPCLCLPCKSIKKVSDCLKKYSLKLQNFKPLCDIDYKKFETTKNREFDSYRDYKMILMDPRKVNRYCDIGEADRLLLEANGVGEELFCQHDLCLKYEHWKADEVLRAVIPGELESVSGYSLVGHIVHLNLRDELAVYRGLIGEVLLDKVKCARTVVNKIHSIHSTYRNFEMEVLAGEDDLVTTVRENKFSFEFDFSQVYWNPRLSTEHERIVNMLESGDVLYDVFCGVGPFCIPAAKKGCRTLANDLNPHSVKWLKINLKRNKIKESYIHVFNKDGCDFIKDDIKSGLLSLEPGNYNIKIVMNLPALAPSFLIHFKQLFSEEEYLRIRRLPTPRVFLYCFSKGVDKHEERVKQMVENELGLNLDEEITQVFFVRNVAPNKEMMRVTLLLTEKILLNRKRAASQEEEVNLKKAHD